LLIYLRQNKFIWDLIKKLVMFDIWKIFKIKSQ
jgi:hypothetical protein